MSKAELFSNQSVNGVSEWHNSTGTNVLVFCWGAFAGGTCQIELSPDGGATSFPIAAATFTSDSEPVQFTIPPGILFRASLSGSGAGASINCLVAG